MDIKKRMPRVMVYKNRFDSNEVDLVEKRELDSLIFLSK